MGKLTWQPSWPELGLNKTLRALGQATGEMRKNYLLHDSLQQKRPKEV